MVFSVTISARSVRVVRVQKIFKKQSLIVVEAADPALKRDKFPQGSMPRQTALPALAFRSK